jgi:transaldolase
MPDKTLLAFADHGEVREPLPADGGDAEQVLAKLNEAGIDTDALAVRLQEEGKDSFDKSWKELLETIASKGEKLVASG